MKGTSAVMSRRRTWTFLLVVVFTAGGLWGCGQAGEQAEPTAEEDEDEVGVALGDSVRLEVDEAEPYGQYLTDGNGRTLYMFTADSAMSSSCYDQCAQVWPPLIAEAGVVAGEGVDSTLIATFERENDSTQVAYNEMPLYYFQKDQGPGAIEGQDVHGFGGEWYLVSPAGEMIETTAKAEGGTQ